jgi:Cu/Zn superoxide dismutase
MVIGCSAPTSLASGSAKSSLLAVAELKPTQGNSAFGMAWLKQEDDHVVVTVRVDGLAPNHENGMHIHDKGDCSSPDASSAGENLNPKSARHGPADKEHHLGDPKGPVYCSGRFGKARVAWSNATSAADSKVGGTARAEGGNSRQQGGNSDSTTEVQTEAARRARGVDGRRWNAVPRIPRPPGTATRTSHGDGAWQVWPPTRGALIPLLEVRWSPGDHSVLSETTFSYESTLNSGPFRDRCVKTYRESTQPCGILLPCLRRSRSRASLLPAEGDG